MATKDILTLIVSSAAFGLSLFATWSTLRSKKAEMKISLRSQLSTIVAKLLELASESEKLWNENPTRRGDPHIQDRLSLLNQNRAAYARQATFLIEQIPELASDVEYATVATAFDAVGDLASAADYWKKAVDRSPSSYYEVLNTRGYATFLYNRIDVEEGRRQFERAITRTADGNDHARWTRGFTYVLWADLEKFRGDGKRANELLKSAMEICSTITDLTLAAHAREAIDAVSRRPMPSGYGSVTSTSMPFG